MDGSKITKCKTGTITSTGLMSGSLLEGLFPNDTGKSSARAESQSRVSDVRYADQRYSSVLNIHSNSIAIGNQIHADFAKKMAITRTEELSANPESDRKHVSCRDRSMSMNTVKSMISKESGVSSTCSLGSLSGSNLTMEQRKQRVIKYWEKKKQRMNKNHVRYHCRKDLAENRFRYHGRFISKDQMEKILANEGGLDEIYNPKMKCTPKTK